ncbi:MAG: divalent-cation tolerance protein CutA [Bryobacteraceae bacterium]
MTGKVVVFSTCETEEEARKLARHLVEARVAACVNIVPGIRSVYQWQGKVEEAAEFLLIIKSSRPLFERLREELTRMHSYTVPEVVALSIVDGYPAYLDWMDRELGLRPSTSA